MVTANGREIIEEAIRKAEEINPQPTDGSWLEVVTLESAPYIRDWDISDCWKWAEWPDREAQFPGVTGKDTGIDAVAKRRADGKLIAIQCKSRRLDENGIGKAISKGEIDAFAAASQNDLWAERWLITNGNNELGTNASKLPWLQEKPIKVVNIVADLHQQRQADSEVDECAHCRPNPDGEKRIRSRSCMQNEAVAASVRILREHEQSDSGGLPKGEARGKIILPCGTGKTRISLRIIEELTPTGEVSIVLCPSIALVAQLRREYLQRAAVPLNVLAVCSDQTAGYSPKKEGSRNTAKDPTADNSNFSADDVKGRVTTDPKEIADWLREPVPDTVRVLIGTYQSSARVSEALLSTGIKAQVMIADEAHRTAGLKRKTSKSVKASTEAKRIVDFTVCHDSERFPAKYRVYQTATPRIYTGKQTANAPNSNWIVRDMDDPATFGVELYRKNYLDAVKNGWLSDYRIIAMGINDPSAFDTANILAKHTRSAGRRKLTTTDYLRGLAFALTIGGGTQGGDVSVNSCIAFMNTVDKSKNMAADLQSPSVRKWVANWLNENANGQRPANYSLEHMDASNNVAAREQAKMRLAEAGAENPHGVINVGIFGEGTDSPSLSAVAFLESRKSPIDVIQAVGRAMRITPGKDMGYIICPILIPPDADPESWMAASDMEEGWQELGEILLALRAHDSRIEDDLDHLLQLYIPEPPPEERSIVGWAGPESERIQYGEFLGKPGEGQKAVEDALDGKTRAEVGITRIGATPTLAESTAVYTGKKNEDGSLELRLNTVARDKPKIGEARGVPNIRKTKAKMQKMINNGEGGVRLKPRQKRLSPQERADQSGQLMLKLSGLDEYGNAIKMNLLSKSGLTDNRIARDLNILESGVNEAARHLREDKLLPALNRHLDMDMLKPKKGKNQADGCVVAALLLMNAAMLHQRISNGRWLAGVSDLSAVKNDTRVVQRMSREWERIMRHDFRPVLEPALETIYAIEETGKTTGLERALHHLSAEAARIAETYANMGADHAGPLFNRVMGNQASDGAYFTRPVAASLAARLTLDACDDADWSDTEVWRNHKTVDLACGSGTLLAAMLTEMKRRAAESDPSVDLAQLQKLAVEEVMKGMDINPVSLQLAASQLTAGNRHVSYRGMGLHQMPYGPARDDPGRVSAGTLELLGQKSVVARPAELDLGDDAIGSQATWEPINAELEDAVDAARNARIAIMNPPFTNRNKMGEKFPKDIQDKLRTRADLMANTLIGTDPGLEEFWDKNSIAPLFVALADHCVDRSDGLLTMINPTIALDDALLASGSERRSLRDSTFTPC